MTRRIILPARRAHPLRGSRWGRWAAAAAAGTVVLGVGVAAVQDASAGGRWPGRRRPAVSSPATVASSSPASTVSTSTSGAGTTPAPQAGGRRGVWYAIGQSPTAAQLEAAPALYGVVILNPWETAALHRLKQLDPTVQVLMYKCLSSTRSYDTTAHPPAGVTYAAAQAHPSWFATTTSGARIEWNGYAGHWQMAVWDRTYQEAWTSAVVDAVTADAWDGVLADNDVYSLRWYSGAVLAGTSSTEATDAALRDGLQQLLATAGPALNARGKKLVPNVSDARLVAGRWAAHTRWGGGMEENFTHFGTGTGIDSYVTDWGATGWLDQTGETASPGLTLAVTPGAENDTGAARYGYASLLVRGDEDSFWQPATGPLGYAAPRSLPEQAWRTGAPVGVAVQGAGGVWTRAYAGVWAAVNPTRTAATVTAPAGAHDASGATVTTLRLEPASGAVLRLS